MSLNLLSYMKLILVSALFAGSVYANPRGIAVCVGLNKVDKEHYGSPLELAGCHNDAQDLATLFASIKGFETPTVLLDKEATVSAVSNEIVSAASKLEDGDLFVLSVAAHGSQLPDLNKDEAKQEPTDQLDETWLLYDRMWIDDERYALWRKFKKGVRIVVIADTCHSGTSVRHAIFPGSRGGSGGGSVLILNGEFASFDPLSRPALNLGAEPRDLIQGVNALQSDVEFATSMREVADRAKTFPIKEAGRGFRSLGLGRDVGIVTRDLSKLSRSVRSLARQDALALYAARREIYDPILSMSVLAVRERAPIDATLILLAACQDYQTAADGEVNGAFTGTL